MTKSNKQLKWILNQYQNIVCLTIIKLNPEHDANVFFQITNQDGFKTESIPVTWSRQNLKHEVHKIKEISYEVNNVRATIPRIKQKVNY